MADPTTFLPSTDSPPSEDDALRALDATLETLSTNSDLIVAAEPPPPVGRSWAFDWSNRQFVGTERSSPRETRDQETLKEWIVKCLRTSRGMHPVHPDGYGLVPPSLGLIGGPVGTVPADLEANIRDALIFHPRITDVSDFAYAYDPDGEQLYVSFNAELANGDQLVVADANLNLAL